MLKIYSKNNCPQCKMTKRLLDQRGVAYQEINLDEQPEYTEQVKELGYKAAPVVVYDGGHFSGFKPDMLRKL